MRRRPRIYRAALKIPGACVCCGSAVLLPKGGLQQAHRRLGLHLEQLLLRGELCLQIARRHLQMHACAVDCCEDPVLHGMSCTIPDT